MPYMPRSRSAAIRSKSIRASLDRAQPLLLAYPALGARQRPRVPARRIFMAKERRPPKHHKVKPLAESRGSRPVHRGAAPPPPPSSSPPRRSTYIEAVALYEQG